MGGELRGVTLFGGGAWTRERGRHSRMSNSRLCIELSSMLFLESTILVKKEEIGLGVQEEEVAQEGERG